MNGLPDGSCRSNDQMVIKKENNAMLQTSSSKRYLPLVCLGLLALITTTLASKSRVVFADERSGHLSVTKDCSNYTGLAGSFCTIESSNIPEITNGATIFYDQPLWAAVTPATPEGNNIALDSNVVLWVAGADWAAGRCTLDPTFHGICTFSHGTGQLAGFHASVDVAPIGGSLYTWAGSYRFSRERGE